MRILITVLILLSLGLAQAAMAFDRNKGFYAGMGATLTDVDAQSQSGSDVKFLTGEILAGYQAYALLGLEVRYGVGLLDEAVSLVDAEEGEQDTAHTQIDDYFSYYYRAELRNSIAKIYILLGQSDITTSSEFDTDTVTTSASGFSYGIGTGLMINKRANFNFEFRSMIETDEDDFTSLGINVDFRF